MSNLSEQFGDFGGTNDVSFDSNDPKVREYSDKITYLNGEVRLFKPPQDVKSHARFIPWPEINYFAKQARLHQGIGPEKNSFPCPKMLGEDRHCPLCKHSREMYAAGDQKQGSAFGGKNRHLCWVIDRKNPHLDPMIWDLPQETIDTIRNMLRDPRTGAVRSIDNLDNGYDIFFVRRPKSPGVEFITVNDIQLDTAPTVLGSVEQVRQWTTFIKRFPFKDLFNWTSPEKMAIIAGINKTDGEDDGWTGEQAASEAPPRQDPKPVHVESPVASAHAEPQTPTANVETASPSKESIDTDALRASIAARFKK